MEEATTGVETSLGFFDVEKFGKACQLCNWTVGIELQNLVGIAEDDEESGAIRIAAMEAIRKRMLHTLQLSGYITRLERKAELVKDNEDGSRKVLTMAEEVHVLNTGNAFLKKMTDGKAGGTSDERRCTEIHGILGAEPCGTSEHEAPDAGHGPDEDGRDIGDAAADAWLPDATPASEG